MKRYLFVIILIIYFQSAYSQSNTFYQFDFLIGNWVGSGVDIDKNKSEISASYSYTTGNTYIEVNHHSEIEKKNKKFKNEVHDDWGMISYDKQRGVYIYRQFNIEGYYNQFILIDSLSNENTIVFESEQTENFLAEGKFRLIVKKINNFEIETFLDLVSSGKEISYGKNKLIKEE